MIVQRCTYVHNLKMMTGVLLACIVPLAAGQGDPSSHNESVLKQHYEAAERSQSAGNLPEAARQYRLFIADAVAEMALETAALQEYDKAAPLFDEALRLAPRSPGLRIRYAQAALAANDLPRAQTLTTGVLRDFPENKKALTKAHLLLGRALAKANREDAARDQFEAAVRLDPNFENGYALAISYLDAGDRVHAEQVFKEMLSGLGDSAFLHLQIGQAYLNSDFQPLAIPELKLAVAKDAKLPGAHYALAVALLTVGGEGSDALAKEQLQEELAVSPKNAAPLVQLGSIALRAKQYAAAEEALTRALTADPSSPDAFFFLGQCKQATGQNEAAIAAFRRSIALTKDPAYNRYQVQKAHYLLGRLLMQTGETDAGKQELQISSTLLEASLHHDRSRLAGMAEPASGPERADSDSLSASAPGGKTAANFAELQTFEQHLAPALADSYNNLGVIQAQQQDFTEALLSFQQAFQWKPGLEGLDANWGRAAFTSGQFEEAVAPLARSLRQHPENFELRSELAISEYRSGDFSAALSAVQPVVGQLQAAPALALVYGDSLVKTGKVDDGIERLKALEQAQPKLAEVHACLGEVYQRRGDSSRARTEWSEAARLRPTFEAYSALGALELDAGRYGDAIPYLESAVKLEPGNLQCHKQLSLAYRKTQREQDARREQATYEALSQPHPKSPDAN